jgi:peptidyl-prolyl cis-trans isomerase D
MLKAMRKNVKSLSPILWIVIATFIIAIFAVWGGAGRIGESGGSNLLATVGGDKITADVFSNALRQRLTQLRDQYKEITPEMIRQLNLPQRVLEEMIQQDLLLQMAKDMGLSASNEELREKIVTYPSFQREGKFIGTEAYEELLRWNHIPVAEFEGEMRKDIILTKLVRVVTAGLAVTPQEAWENYQKQNETARVEYLVLENDKVQLPVEPTPAEVEAYFERNKDKFKIPEKRDGVYAFLRTDDLKKEVELTESEIEKYYNDNLDQFKKPEEIEVSRIFLPLEGKAKDLVLAEARNILDELGKGADFADLAKKYSKDSKASQGGSWGLTEWMSLSAPEQEQIRKLEVGQVSPPVELEDGVSILKVTRKTPAATTPLSEAKARIRTMLEEQKAQALATERITRLEKDARKEKSLESAATRSNFKVDPTGLLKKGEALGSADPSGVISSALFNLADKDISAPLYTYRGVGLVQLRTVVPPHEAKLDEVRDQVLQDLDAARKKEQGLKEMQAVRESIAPATNWEDLAKKDNLELKTVNEHKRGEYLGTIGENAEVDQLAFSLPPGTVSDPVEFAGGYVLLKVLDRKQVTREDFEKEQSKEMDSLLADRSNRLLTSYLIKLREEKGVTVRYNTFLKVQSDILSRFGE